MKMIKHEGFRKSLANGLLTISHTNETFAPAVPRNISSLNDTAKVVKFASKKDGSLKVKK